jgi:hypothetical protein
MQVTLHPVSCFPRVLSLAQRVPCLLLKAEKMICCAIKSKFIAARSKFYENKHRKIHVLFGSFYRGACSFVLQFCLSRGR